MFAKLTDQGGGTWGLPVTRVVGFLGGVLEQVGNSLVAIDQLDPAARRDRGWYDFAEDAVDLARYDPGAPVDTIENMGVRRRFPSATLRPAPDLRALRATEIEALHLAVAQGGFIFTPGSIPARSDPQTQADTVIIATALLDGETLPAQFKIRDAGGTLRQVNANQFASYRTQMARHLILARKRANDHLEAVAALSDPAAILAYDITTGWPANPTP